ncbi:MAG: hypothetical protein WEE50_03540 [Chloroflexota bacterium]
MSLRRTPRRRLPLRRLTLLAVLVGVAGGTFAVSTDAFGAGHLFERALDRIDRFIAGPVPDRPTEETVLVTSPPVTPAPTATPTPKPPPSGAAPVATPIATPTPTPTPARVPVDVDIVDEHDAVFAHELKDTWCAPAGVQMTLAVLGLADTSDAFQSELQGRVREWESYGDSHNGKWGPSAMVLALEAYGATGYEVRGYETRQDALRDAAVAIDATGSPVILLAWRGAHTWVMTGYRADADPRLFPDATVEGGYVLDPWYPWVSSIWGPSDPPGTFQDAAEMERNYLRWKRPEGLYPDRDGLFISVVPTLVVSPAG